MASYSEILFGRILLKNRLATFAQIQDCLRLAKGQTLGEVMIQKGLIKPAQARQVQKAQALMQFMRAEKLFARILVERKLVDVATLRKAFEVQEKQRYKVRLAQIPVRVGDAVAGTQGAGVIVVTHDHRALDVFDTHYEMEDGRLRPHKQALSNSEAPAALVG